MDMRQSTDSSAAAAYPSLDPAVAAGSRDGQGDSGLVQANPAEPKTAKPWAADPADRTRELLDQVVTSIFEVGLLLQATAELPRDATGPHITEALRRLDDVVQEVRLHAVGKRSQATQPGQAGRSTPEMQEQLARTTDHMAALKERVVQTAHALQVAAADTAALLQQQTGLIRRPGRMDYPTEVKRWQAFADQAGQMAKRWEQPS